MKQSIYKVQAFVNFKNVGIKIEKNTIEKKLNEIYSALLELETEYHGVEERKEEIQDHYFKLHESMVLISFKSNNKGFTNYFYA